jgi:excisionase family DNA binding protein
VPPEVEAAIDKRSSMAAVGNLTDYVKYEMAKGMGTGQGGGGTAAELAVGFGIAQQMMQQGMAGGGVQPPTVPVAGAAPAAVPGVEMLSPADVGKALGVPESDVMAIITSGELKAKKIGTSFRITRAALDAYLTQ